MLKNATLYLGTSALNKALTFLLLPLFTHLMAPGDFGLVRQVLAIAGFLIIVSTFGLDESIAREYFDQRHDEAAKRPRVRGIVRISLAFSVVGGLGAAVLLSFFSGQVIGQDVSSQIAIGVSIYVAGTPIVNVYKKVLRVDEQPLKYAGVVLANTLAFIALAIIFIRFLLMGAEGYVVALSLVTAGLTIYALGQFEVCSFRESKRVELTRKALAYGVAVLPHSLFSWFVSGATVLAVGIFESAESVGVFVAVGFVPSMLNVLVLAIFDAYQPWTYRTLRAGADHHEKYVLAARTIGLFVVIIGGVLASFSPELTRLFIDGRYHAGLELAPLLTLSAVFVGLGSVPVFVLYYYRDATRLIGRASFVGAGVNVCLLVLLIPPFGLMGAAMSLVVANLGIALLKQRFADIVLGQSLRSWDLYVWACIFCLIPSYLNWSEHGLWFRASSCVVILVLMLSMLHQDIRGAAAYVKSGWRQGRG